MTGLKNRATKTQQQSTCRTHWKHSLKCRPWALHDFYFIRPLHSGAGDITGFSTTEKKADVDKNAKREKIIPNERAK